MLATPVQIHTIPGRKNLLCRYKVHTIPSFALIIEQTFYNVKEFPMANPGHDIAFDFPEAE